MPSWSQVLVTSCVLWLASPVAATAGDPSNNNNSNTTTWALDGQHDHHRRLEGQRPVTSIKVRMQNDRPEWNPTLRRWGSSFALEYKTPVDSVNMASVEGLLFFYHAMFYRDGRGRTRDGPRYIVFYKTQVTQPTAAMDHHHGGATRHPLLEHGPYVRFDNGQCRAEEGTPVPPSCLEYAGAPPRVQRLGYYIGGYKVSGDLLRHYTNYPYPNTYWFSFPGECPTRPRQRPPRAPANVRIKDDACRAAEPGGLCPLNGNALGIPDGTTCTFNYEILGWIDLNEVFTHQNVNEATFFANPRAEARNAARIQAVLQAYAAAAGANMQPLPTVDALRAMNPPCHETAHECRTQPCQRLLYSQICLPCDNVSDPTCIRPPASAAAAAGGNGNANPSGGGPGKKGGATGDQGKSGQAGGGQAATGQAAGGKVTTGQATAGQATTGQAAGGKGTAGQATAGQGKKTGPATAGQGKPGTVHAAGDGKAKTRN